MNAKKDVLFDRALATFGNYSGVMELGIGFKEVGHSFTNIRALCVVVSKKLPLSEVPPGERIPEYFEGMPTDVSEPLTTIPIGGTILPIQGGDPHTSVKGYEGTLGCFAKKTIDGVVTPVMLTAGHTLVDGIGPFGPGGDIGSPDVSCSLCCTSGVVATILEGTITDELDCGIAKMVGKRSIEQLIPGLGPDKDGVNSGRITGLAPLKLDPESGVMVPVAPGDTVRKVGATSGLTTGTVNKVSYEVPADGELPAMIAQIIIEPNEDGGKELNGDGKSHFAQEGDSGAVVVDDQNRIIGLLIRKADFSNVPDLPSWVGFGGVATDIHRVVGFLGIEIFTSDEQPPATSARFLRPGIALRRAHVPTEEELGQRKVIEEFRQEMEEFPLGERFVRFLEEHQREMVELANHDRRVSAPWQRAKGPAFMNLLLRSIGEPEQAIPKKLEEVDFISGLDSVQKAIQAQGSEALREELSELWPLLHVALTESESFPALFENLRQVNDHA